MNHVVHFHGPWAAETEAEGMSRMNIAMKRSIERLVYSSAKAFVTLSEAFKNSLANDYRVDPERIYVIPGGVRLERFSPGARDEARERLGWPKNGVFVLCVRRLVRRMGLEMLIDAFAAIAHQQPDSFLIIGGAGPLREELEAKVKTYNLSRQIRFLGFVPESDLPLAYRAADLSIVPSKDWKGLV